MANRHKAITAEELDSMTPDQRAKAFRERVVTDPELLPSSFRRRIDQTAQRLSVDRSDGA